MGREPDYLAFMREISDESRASSSSGRASIHELRRRHSAALRDVPRPPVAEVRDLTLGGPAGPIPARLYRPAAGTGRPAPALVFAHGGGWVMGDVEAYDPVARALAVAGSVAVVSIDYRRPPEHPFPAPVDDTVAALRAVVEQAGSLGLDARRVGIAGDSAGGNLAAAAALRLRDAGEPSPAVQLLVYPALDLREIPPLPPDPDGLVFSDPHGRGAAHVRDLYLAGADPADPLASPLAATDLHGLPPTIIATAEYDRLRGQGEEYAARLTAAGVDTTLIHGTGLDHGFLGHGAYARRPAQVITQIGAQLRTALSPT